MYQSQNNWAVMNKFNKELNACQNLENVIKQ